MRLLQRLQVLLTGLLVSCASLSAAGEPAATHAFEPAPLDPIHAIAATRHLKLSSETLGRPLNLLVKPPADIDSGRVYPAVYLLDGGALFPMLAGYYNYLRFEDAVPDLFIIGLSYGAATFEGGNYRSTDYTAPSAERDYWGGAGRFQRALQDEIIPAVEAGFPVDPSRRILFGQSIGGQFVLYAAMQGPALFWGHIASNPALHRNLDYFLNLEPRAVTPMPGLYVASGSRDVDEFRTPAKTWMNHWRMRPQQAVRLKVEDVEGYGHFSLAPESFRRGLAWLFESADPGPGVPEEP